MKDLSKELVYGFTVSEIMWHLKVLSLNVEVNEDNQHLKEVINSAKEFTEEINQRHLVASRVRQTDINAEAQLTVLSKYAKSLAGGELASEFKARATKILNKFLDERGRDES